MKGNVALLKNRSLIDFTRQHGLIKYRCLKGDRPGRKRNEKIWNCPRVLKRWCTSPENSRKDFEKSFVILRGSQVSSIVSVCNTYLFNLVSAFRIRSSVKTACKVNGVSSIKTDRNQSLIDLIYLNKIVSQRQ